MNNLTYKKILLLFSLIFSSLVLKAQDFPLQCKGHIPTDFTQSTYDKINRNKQEINEDNSKSKYDRNTEKEFIEASHYKIDRLLSSGFILFGDTLTHYVNKVAKNVLKKSGNKDLLDEVRFYTYKSSQVNAFTTHQGMIFISIGLLAQLENETQLAMVLAHEIVHYQKNHVIEKYKNNKKETYSSSRVATENLLKKLSNYSKDNELEADELGLEMVIKAGYSPEKALDVLNVLEYSHLPFDEKTLQKSFFEDEYYKIPTDYFVKGTDNTIKDHSEEDDEFASHPNIKSRRKAFTANVLKADNLKGKEYFSATEYKNSQTIARIENMNNDLLNGKYTKVIYAGFLLKNADKKFQTFIKENVAKAFYAIAKIRSFKKPKYKREYSYTTSSYLVIENEDKKVVFTNPYEGQLSILFDMLYTKTSKEEINIMALKQILLHNKNNQLNLYADDLWKDLKLEYDLSPSDFILSKEKYKELHSKDIELNESDTLSKLERIKIIAEKEKLNKQKKYFYAAFVSEFENKKFYIKVTDYLDNLKEVEKKLKDHLEDDGYMETYDYIRNYSFEKDNREKPNKILVIQPFYAKLKKQKLLYANSLKGRKTNIESIHKTLSYHKIDFTIYDQQFLKEKNVDYFNEMSLILDWKREWSLKEKYNMIPLNHVRFTEFSKNKGFDKILFTGSIESINDGGTAGASSLTYLFLPPLYPYIIHNLITSNSTFLYFSILRDTESLEKEYAQSIYLGKKQSSIDKMSQIDNTINEIKNPKK